MGDDGVRSSTRKTSGEHPKFSFTVVGILRLYYFYRERYSVRYALFGMS